jgi:hypothetical protein
MKSISLQRAYDLVEEAAAVIVNHDGLTYPQLEDLIGDPDNEWLYLRWADNDWNTFSVVFNESANPRINMDGNLVMTDHEGEDTILSLLRRIELEG